MEAGGELTGKAGKWLLKEAKVGATVLADRKEYYLTVVPKEMAGGTLVARTPGDTAVGSPTCPSRPRRT